MSRKLDFVKLQKSFKYSINIKYDIGNYNKINNFIPTSQNLDLFRDVLNSFKNDPISRSRILLGAYGTGKSFFGMILGSILTAKNETNKFDDFLNKVSEYDNKLANNLKGKVISSPYLLVLPSNDYNTFKQSMLNGLKKALVREDISEDIFPKTNFEAVKNKIEIWRRNYPGTYDKFENIVNEDFGCSIEDFNGYINNFDEDAYQFFIEVYPRLTSGSNFDPFSNANLNDIYQEVNREIMSKGYNGVYVIFDEFNRLLENNVENFDGNLLQEFAEFANESGKEEIHLFLISHKNMVQYASGLSEDVKNEWRKIEDRFKVLEAVNCSSQIYELISSVIQKEEENWRKFKREDEINKLTDLSFELEIFPSYDYETLKKNIVEGCYPLHPLVVNLLPKLAQRIGQNERTLFTFLSTDEKFALGDFLNINFDNKFPVLGLDKIYDYFADLMKQEMEFESIYNAWAESQVALQKIDDTQNIKTLILKCLAIIQSVNNFSDVPPSRDVIKLALIHRYDSRKTEEAIDELIDSKIILERKSQNQISFFNGSEFNIEELIEEKKSHNEINFNPNFVLQNHFNLPPIYPKRYNDKYKIRRYFISRYMFINEFLKIDDWEKYLNDELGYVDGAVIYLLYQGETSYAELKEKIRAIDCKRVIFVLPKNQINRLSRLLKRLDALLIIREDQELIDSDPLVEDEVEVYINETKNAIENELHDKLISTNKKLVYNNGSIIEDKYYFSEIISEICEEVYDETPKVNNELLVRDNITSPQKKARKKINEELLFNGLNKRLNIEGYGPDFLIYRSLFKNTNLLDDKDESFMIKDESELKDSGQEEVETNLRKVLKLIEKEVYINKDEKSLDHIYEELRRPPYGIRLGLIPLLLVIAGRINNYIDQVIIKHNGEERKIEAQLFEEINRYPNRYSIKVLSWNEYKECYIETLENIFLRGQNKSNNEVNRINQIYKAVRDWLIDQPNYTKETTDISQTSDLLRKSFLMQRSDPKTIILEIIPSRIIGSDEFNNDSWKEEALKELQDAFENFYEELENSYENLKTELTLYITEHVFPPPEEEQLTFFESDFKKGIMNWYQGLAKETKHYTFDNKTNSFLQFIKSIKVRDYQEGEILNRLAKIITGFELKDWNDDLKQEFKEKLRKIKSDIERFDGEKNHENINNGRIEIKIKEGETEELVRNFDSQDLDGFADVLRKQVKGAFKDIGDSVSDVEKQQILVDLLKDIINQEL